jgi:crotonobetainyl-CoA:carnitine CoA-transferase CaiB-like acyl-CoA transferase
MGGPLGEIRVVDFSRVLSGPHCTKTLHDLGAAVIKVEPPRPDVSRFALPRQPGLSHYYAQQNSGKRCLSLDLNVSDARGIALRLCETADVIVENFRPGTLKYFGLDYTSVAARNPRVIYASISGYGQHGPLSSRSAYAPTVQAESGFTDGALRHYGSRLNEKRHDAYSHADVYTGLEAAIAILAALHERDATGIGQQIDVAMAATMLAVNERVHVDLSGADVGAEPVALGPAESLFFTFADGTLITIATSLVGSNAFQNFVRAMRRPDLAEDPRFATAAARTKNLGALQRIVQHWIDTFPSFEELNAQLDEAKLAVGIVRSVAEVSESDWAGDWGAIDEVSDRQGGTIRIPGRPWHFSSSRLDHPGEPAFQGEHNLEILAELGYCEADIDRFLTNGALCFGAS